MNTFAFGRTRPDNAILRSEKITHWGEPLLDIGTPEASPTGTPTNHLTCYYVYDRTKSFDSSVGIDCRPYNCFQWDYGIPYHHHQEPQDNWYHIHLELKYYYYH
jgi:hypothetical protein